MSVGAAWQRASSSPRWLAGSGLAGTVCIAVSSYWVAAIPTYFRTKALPVVSLLPVGAFQARLVFYFGLSALLLSWLYLGRLILQGAPGTDLAFLRRVALAWAAPLVFAIPLDSRDLWAYAAQSQLVLHHLNPYHFGPSALPGAFSVEVAHRWVDTPAPYGPLWLSLGRAIAAIVGEHVGITVFVLRLLAVVGLVLLAYSLPTLARRANGRPEVAIWMVVANPLTLILGVGGGHNDLLMAGLMMCGLQLVTGPGSFGRSLLGGTALLTAAVAVKSPSAIALAFAVPLWLAHAPAARSWSHRRGAGLATALVSSASIALFGAVTWLSGLGLGWIKQVNSSTTVVSWMSLPSGAAILWDLVTLRFTRILKFDEQMSQFRHVGSALAITIVIGLWLLSMSPRRPGFLRALPRWIATANAWQLMAVAFVVVVVLGPSVQPWYFGWALTIAGLLRLDARTIAVIAGLSIGMVAMIRPNGVGLQMNPAVVPILGLHVLIALAILAPRSKDPLPITVGVDRV